MMKSAKVNIIQGLTKSDLKDKKVLIIDEIDDTRKTMLYCRDKLHDLITQTILSSLFTIN